MGDVSNGATDQEVVERLLDIVPQAQSVRSHSMLQSTRVLDLFQRNGLTHDVNQFIPSGAGLILKPWRLWNGMTRVPYVWEDDMHCMFSETDQLEIEPSVLANDSSLGIRVFDFHPIHVFLNTESLDRYERTRALHRTPEELIHHRYDGYGTRSRLIDLLRLAHAS